MVHSRTDAAKWAPIAALLLIAGLLAGGALSGTQALVAWTVLELLLLVAIGIVIARAIRRRRQGGAASSALQAGLEAVLPRPAARVVSLEPRLFACLWRWARRRKPTADHVFPYAKRSPLGALVVVVLVTAPVEILLIELLLPWAWLRWLLVIGSVYAALWLLGLYASLQVLPHEAGQRGLTLHYGLFNRVTIPWGMIDSVTLERGTPPKGQDGLTLDPATGRAWLAVGGRTDLRLDLREPVTVDRLRGATPPITTLHVAADDPEALARAVTTRPEQTGTPPAQAEGARR